jgi:hypothetical protein
VDCAGECNGSAELDACGVCDGGETDPNNCFESNTLWIDWNANGDLDVYMYNEDAVAGFQFNLTGINILSASGGSAESNGFTLSTSSSTVLGFSLTGGTIAPGTAVLTVLSFEIIDESACIQDVIISDPLGGAFIVSTGDCIELGEPPVLGCTDDSACNYDPNANSDDGSCDYAEENFDCNGNCLIDTDCAGECGGSAAEDCAGECNGTAELDDCGVCDGDNLSCEVYIELEVTTTVDESILDDMDAFEDDFCGLIETELDLPGGSCDVTDVTISDTRDDVEITVDFTITLTEDELADTEFESEDDINDAWTEVEDEIDDGLPEFIEGCTDENANNYNPEATIDDGSCESGPDTVDYCIETNKVCSKVKF